MTQVVYADILFIINTYVTYALLRSTDLICHIKTSRLRTVLSSLLGGAFSFVVLFDGVSNFVIALSRVAGCFLLLFAAYYPFERKKFFRLFLGFFLVNFVFAGFMFALWFLFAPKSMLYFGGIVYFDIDAVTLLIYTAACYGIISLSGSLLRMKTPPDSVFELEIGYCGKCCTCKALLDTGNSLFEPFSSLPVIVCERKIFDDAFEIENEKLRLVPCSSVSSESVLKAFRPDFVNITGARTKKRTKDVYIALTENRIRNSEFGALLHPGLFEDIHEKGGEVSCSRI